MVQPPAPVAQNPLTDTTTFLATLRPFVGILDDNLEELREVCNDAVDYETNGGMDIALAAVGDRTQIVDNWKHYIEEVDRCLPLVRAAKAKLADSTTTVADNLVNEARDQYLQVITERRLDLYLKWAKDKRFFWNRTLKAAEDFISKNTPMTSTGSGPRATTPHINTIKLPQRELSKFSNKEGTIPFYDWLNDFDNLISANPQLTDVDRMGYLRQSLLEGGEPHQLALSASMDSAGYTRVMDQLKTLYGNKTTLIPKTILELQQLGVANSASEIRNLMVEIERLCRKLEMLGQTPNEITILTILESKLGYKIFRRYTTIKGQSTTPWSTQNFRKTLMTLVQDQELFDQMAAIHLRDKESSHSQPSTKAGVNKKAAFQGVKPKPSSQTTEDPPSNNFVVDQPIAPQGQWVFQPSPQPNFINDTQQPVFYHQSSIADHQGIVGNNPPRFSSPQPKFIPQQSNNPQYHNNANLVPIGQQPSQFSRTSILQNNNSPQSFQNNNSPQFGQSSPAFSGQSRSPKAPCYLCGGNHWTENCGKYADSDSRKR